MQFTQLGTSDLNVSRIGFGCMSLGDDHQSNSLLLHSAFDKGINFFDTADLYQAGFNEETVGRAFKGMRQKVIIATKVGNQLRKDGSGWDWNPSKAYIMESVYDSLRRLQTDYIDLYQLHGGTIEDPYEEAVEAFEALKNAGHIRHYGISSIRPNVIRRFAANSGITSNMMQYSLLDRRPEETCLDILKEKEIGLIVRGAVAKGLVAGKSPASYLSYTAAEVEELQQQLSNLTGPNTTMGQLALQFCLAHPAISTIALGMSKEEQIVESTSLFEQEELTAEVYEELKRMTKVGVYEKHR